MVFQKKNKIPLTKKAPGCLKKPRDNYIPSDSYLQYSPVWRFDYIDMHGPWGWLNIESKDELKGIMKKLNNFETMTWADIKRNNHSHQVLTASICKTARDRLVEIEKDDLEDIFSLRLNGTNRIWGKLEDGIFYIIWWDPGHKVYPSHLKHT